MPHEIPPWSLYRSGVATTPCGCHLKFVGEIVRVGSSLWVLETVLETTGSAGDGARDVCMH